MKEISTRTPKFVPSIMDENGSIREWKEWSSYFDDILKHPRFVAYCNNETDVTTVYDMIDLFYKIELDMGKVTIELKAI